MKIYLKVIDLEQLDLLRYEQVKESALKYM